MTEGVVPLHRHPHAKVRLACRRCPLSGQYDKDALLARVGPDAGLVDLRLQIAQGLGCETAADNLSGQYRPGVAQCGMHYPDLVA